MGLISSVEIVDVNGNTVAANTQIDTTTGVSSSLPTQFTIGANSFPNANLLDSGSDSSRRLKITTPFGSVVSPNTSAGTFTVSATPAFSGNTAATHAGGGFDGGTSTYDLSNGDLVINGSNFLGIKAADASRELGAIQVADAHNVALGEIAVALRHAGRQ